MRLRTILLPAGMIVLSACRSLAPNAATADVRQAIASRSAQQLEWRMSPSTIDDPRVGALLHDELTADNAVAVAIVNSPRLQATLAQLGIARADLLEASVVRNPLFEAEIRFPRDPFRPFELRLAQTLVDLIRLPRRRALGRAAFEAAATRVTADVMSFAAEIRGRHAELLAAVQRVTLRQVDLEAARASTELAQRQHDAGNITDLELETEQARYEQARLATAREEQHRILAHEALGRAMGLRGDANDYRMPASFPPLPVTEQAESELEQLAAARRLDIDLARRDVELSRGRLPLARLAVLGDITADAHFQRDANGARTTGPGIEVPIPLFNNGAAARSRAEATYLRDAHVLNALLAESSSSLRSARSVVIEARARVEYYRDVIIPRRKRIVELTKLEQNAMLIGPFQLLQAKQSEAQAELDAIEAQRDYWIARNDLEREVNGIPAMTAAPAMDQHLSRSVTSSEGGH